ncbi:MAG: long-chain fatty acid--CoA ligase [Bacteroidetes bacterium]|nr:MAG: long-chain fatty acid--CoA ligase [Bacteroidota bacterium]
MGHRIKADNLALLYRKAADKFESLPAFATRVSALDWKPVSYRELYEQGADLATGLIELGLKQREHVGIFSDNRFEWILCDCAVQLSGSANVPRGRDVTDDELFYIIDHAGIEIAFVETVELQDRVLKLKNRLPALREIILLDHKAKEKEGVKRLEDVCKLGSGLRAQGDKRVEDRISAIKPDDLFTLIYTSGTTGKPKGVMLKHSNMISQVRNLPGYHNCTDRVLSVLPIWHIFERVIEMYTLSFGGCTFYSSIVTIGEDMRNVEPTFMASAPRLWEKLHERILKGVKASHPVRQILFHIAYFLSRQYKNSEYFITDKYLKMNKEARLKRFLLMPLHILRWIIVLPWYGFFNAAVLERIRLGVGGSLKATISGGGALPIHIDKFFNYMGIPVLEGYGMTETSPVISVRYIKDLVVGTVGPPIPETEIRIVEPETGTVLYPNPNLPDNGLSQRGEIWAKGPQVMKGYYRDPELTQLTFKDGWLRTGDLGVITHNNCLKILGRSKSTIVLSSGENVEPEPIEMRLQQSHFIDQCMVVGQDKKYLSVLIVPGISEFRQAGLNIRTMEELALNADANRIIREEIKRLTSTNNGFKRFEQIKDFRMLPQSFEVGRELTNLFKIKRHVVEQKFNHVIDELFANGSPKNN